jgi:D-beta-D-heptose 7-phosphate kinase/D-beta-D-heptose 1-phosphate adenosyltransferase
MPSDPLKRFLGQRALVYGDYLVDKYVGGEVRRISPEAPVPILEVGFVERRPGGAGNVVNNVRSLGAAARAASCIGSDSEGDWLYDELSALGVDMSYFRRDPALRTISKTRIVSKHQQFLRLDEETVQPPPESFASWITETAERLLQGVSVVIISDYGKGAVTPGVAQSLIVAARRRQIPVVVDPKGRDYSTYRGATLCTPNVHELEFAFGNEAGTEDDIARMAEVFCREYAFEYMAITRSERGISLVRNDGTKTDFAATPKEVIDVSGAGDTVASVLALGLAAGAAIEDCCNLANQAASLVISKFGVAPVSMAELTLASSVDARRKQVNAEEAELIAAELRGRGKKIVFTNGCYDILHAGHVASFNQARGFGDVLFVGVNSDASVRRLKGRDRPVIAEQYRVGLLSALTPVDYVVLFDEDAPVDLIQKIKPDVVAKGRDWEDVPIPERDVVAAYGGRLEFLALEEGLSTTSIIDKIRISQAPAHR